MERKRHKTIRLLAVCALLLALCLFALSQFARRSAAEEREESLRSIKQTVQELALQCYVIEGAYPESLAYLEENYGLTVNQEDYLIAYTPYAENLPPEVRVLPRDGTGEER